MNAPDPRPVRVAVQLQPQHADYRQIRRAVRRTPRRLGVDVVFNWDHFFPLYGDPDGKHFECWTMLGGVGRGTPSGSRSARWSPATPTATPNCSPTWPARSTTSATAG